MKFLVDNSLSVSLARSLNDAGHNAVHLREFGLASAVDEIVFERAAAEERRLISIDTDFGTILGCARRASHRSCCSAEKVCAGRTANS